MHGTDSVATPAPHGQRGQTTAEYALVLLGVAAVALAFIAWANGGHVAQFLDSVFQRLLAAGK
jgi:hypothetical protein